MLGVQMLKNQKMGNKLLLAFSLIIIFTSLFISILSYEITSNELENNLLIYSDEYLTQLSRNLENAINELNDDLFIAIRNSGFLNIRSLNNYLKGVQASDNLLGHEFNNLVSKVLASNLSIKAIYIKSSNGDHYYQKDSHINVGEATIESIVNSQTDNVSVMQRLDQDYFIIVKPLIDINDTAVIGQVAVVVDQKFLTKEFKKNETNEAWEILVLDEDQAVMASNIDKAEVLYQSVKGSIATSGKVQKTFTYGSEEYVLNVVTSPKRGIRVMNIIPVDSVALASKKLLVVIVWACFGGLLASFIIAFFLTRGVTKNINLLIEKIRLFKQGDFSTSFEVDSRDEVGVIADEFNAMAIEINHLVNKVYHEQVLTEKATKEAIKFEYDALQAKMNPHFLYNILESINSMAKIEGNENISEVICLLGELLRDSIGDERSNIYLEDELAYTENYLTLKKITSKNSIEVHYEVDEILLGAMVPKFILQPIVENAIVHGISKLSDKGIITIKCYEADQKVIMEVIDNGIGFDHTSIDLHETEDNGQWQRTRVGLNSINKRLKILYGESFGLEIKSQLKVGTKVRLTMPYVISSDIEGGEIDV